LDSLDELLANEIHVASGEVELEPFVDENKGMAIPFCPGSDEVDEEDEEEKDEEFC
jgi:uncharacterized metal-binding protein YceD (DUF177 family)